MANAETHEKKVKVPKSTRGTCTHIKSAQAEMEIGVKLSERSWENRLKNKNTFTFSGKAEGHFVSLFPKRRLTLSLQSVPCSTAIITTRTEPNYSPALHPTSHSHTHTHVSTSHHTPLPARHITPHTQRLRTLHQPHGWAKRERRLEPLGLRLRLGQSESLMSRDRPHRVPCTSCWGQDVTFATWLTLVLKHIYPKQCLTLRLKPSWDQCVSILSTLCSRPRNVKYSQWESE